MKIIKKWKKFNESNSGEELDFETFKDIMTEISDIVDCTFHNYETKGERFYDAKIEIPELSDIGVSDNLFSWEFLSEFIPPGEDPSSYNEIFNNGMIYNRLDRRREIFNELNNKIQDIFRRQDLVKKIFMILERDIIPRFRYFSNFQECSIGFDYNEYNKPELRVTFDIEIDD